jgi:hypothetical protein
LLQQKRDLFRIDRHGLATLARAWD